MGLKYLLVATLLLFLVLTITCSGYTTHYIKPTPDTTCPAEPCLTLSEYAQQSHQYITSNTTLLFLPGVHFLSINFIVENISNFEICNYVRLLTSTNYHPNSTVMCKGLVGIVFRNISSMTLDGLTLSPVAVVHMACQLFQGKTSCLSTAPLGTVLVQPFGCLTVAFTCMETGSQTMDTPAGFMRGWEQEFSQTPAPCLSQSSNQQSMVEESHQ